MTCVQALRVFRKTVGNSSPLVANALHSLGRMLQAKGELDEADTVFRHSLNLEVGVFPNSFKCHDDVACVLDL